MASALLFVLRFLHILSAVSWIGGAFVWGMVIAPRLLRKGPPQIRKPIIDQLVGPLPRFFHSAGIATIVFGTLLLGTMYGWSEFFRTLQSGTYGSMLGLGILFALVILAIGFTVTEPTIKKLHAAMGATPPGTPPTPAQQAELAALGKRMGIATLVSLVLGTVTLGTMVYAVSLHIGL